MTGVQVVQAVVGHALLGVGVLLFCVAGIGLMRFTDPFSRLAATTKSGTLGVCLVLLGAVVLEPTWAHAAVLAVAVALQLMTAPVGGFAIGRASYRSGAPRPAGLQYDELPPLDDDERASGP